MTGSVVKLGEFDIAGMKKHMLSSLNFVQILAF